MIRFSAFLSAVSAALLTVSASTHAAETITRFDAPGSGSANMVIAASPIWISCGR